MESPGSHRTSSHVQMWRQDRKNGWAPKNWCFQTVVLEKTLESPLNCKEKIFPKGNQPWIFTGRTDAETEVSTLWPPNAKCWLIGKDPDTRKDWRQKEKGAAEDKVVTWHLWLNGHEFEQTLGDSEEQGIWHAVIHVITKSWEQLSGWIKTT